MNEPDSSSLRHVIEIAANLDDVSGEVAADAIEMLLAEGALDAWAVPIVMKKGRPAVTLSLLCAETDRDRLAGRMIELTGSFGVRYRPWDRLVLDRRHEQAATPWGEVAVKVGSLDGRVLTRKAEYDDARRVAREAGVPVRRVIEAATSAPGEADRP